MVFGRGRKKKEIKTIEAQDDDGTETDEDALPEEFQNAARCLPQMPPVPRPRGRPPVAVQPAQQPAQQQVQPAQQPAQQQVRQAQPAQPVQPAQPAQPAQQPAQPAQPEKQASAWEVRDIPVQTQQVIYYNGEQVTIQEALVYLLKILEEE